MRLSHLFFTSLRDDPNDAEMPSHRLLVRAELAVGIRTFWWADDVLRFGTGAGITWGSDPESEWAETELKAARLVGLASGVAAETMTD